MKIAIITSGFLPVIDGVTVSGYSRLQKLSEWGHEVLLFCPDYSSLAKVYPDWQDYTGNILPGVRVVNLESEAFFDLDFERNVSRSSYQKLRQELASFQPDIIHVDEPERLFLGFWRIPGVKFAKEAGIPCVSFFRTNFLEYLEDYDLFPGFKLIWLKFLIKRLIVSVYNAYDITLVSSTITHKKLIDLGIKNTRYGNLLGFDGEKFNPGLQQTNFFANKYKLPAVDKQIKLVFLGRLTPDKGWDFTLQVFPNLAQELDINKLALIIVGDGSIRSEIAEKLAKVTRNVHFLGRVSPQDIPALLANCDVHVTASEKETRGLTILEAFASGIPVLAPRAGGVVENIIDGENGFLFTPQDEDDFISKLKILVKNPNLRQAMGEKGKKCVSKYSWDETVRNLVEIWQDLIDKRERVKGKK